ncbi:Fucolectin-1 [Dissostichus eleginoides]|uniref:Fucolectin-1 n=1 Tax=Dissostichus eleginoides TaxID=100907 RepID=A0AAD9CI61_DISEL|nr:Fucolectin-1 [Dissostichus eleginoides]
MTSAVFFALVAFLGLTYGNAATFNIAKRGKVTQSSTAFNGNPERAIDGNLASVYNQDSCTQTTKQRNPWWRLDLQKTYRINTVTITNRKDCCSDRINGAEIRVGNSLNAKGNPNPICAVISSIEAGTSKTFECNGMEGQYVTIVIPGREEYLTLCEVEVTGQPSDKRIERYSALLKSMGRSQNKSAVIGQPSGKRIERYSALLKSMGRSQNKSAVTGQPSATFNIAKRGKVTQSSIAFNGNPERAIDGNLASVYNQDSCTHTTKQRNPWWRLDLQKTYRINTVTITNRKDCCSDRINGAEIRVGNSLNAKGNPNPICAVISSIEAGTSKTFECNGMEGQYVTIVIPGREEYLTLCEDT